MTDEEKKQLNDFETSLRHLIYLHDKLRREHAELQQLLLDKEEALSKLRSEYDQLNQSYMCHLLICRKEGPMKKVMITIGRQFGSGGHKIGEYLSNRLGLSYYDNELILLAARRGNLKVEHIEALEEMIHNPILYERQETVVEDSLEETIFQLQQEVILQIAEEEYAVFVGRSSASPEPAVCREFPKRSARRLPRGRTVPGRLITRSTPAGSGASRRTMISIMILPRMIYPISSQILSSTTRKCATNKRCTKRVPGES